MRWQDEVVLVLILITLWYCAKVLGEIRDELRAPALNARRPLILDL